MQLRKMKELGEAIRKAANRMRALIARRPSRQDDSSRRKLAKHSIKVLCIASKEIADLVRLFLEREGIRQVVTALDGQQGLELARTEQPDVVILDERTPGMDGFKVYTAMTMTGDDSLHRIPVVFIWRGAPMHEPWAPPSKDVIMIPVNPRELVDAIQWIIQAELIDPSPGQNRI